MEFFTSIITSKKSFLCCAWMWLLMGCGKQAIDKEAKSDAIVNIPASTTKISATHIFSEKFIKNGSISVASTTSAMVPNEITLGHYSELRDISARLIFKKGQPNQIVCQYQLLSINLTLNDCRSKNTPPSLMDQIDLVPGDTISLEIDISKHKLETIELTTNLVFTSPENSAVLHSSYHPSKAFSEGLPYEIIENGFLKIPSKVSLSSNHSGGSYSRFEINRDSKGAEITCYYLKKAGDNFNQYLTDCYNRYGTLMYINANDEIYIEKDKTLSLTVQADDFEASLNAEIEAVIDWR